MVFRVYCSMRGMQEEQLSSIGLQLDCEDRQILSTSLHSVSQFWHTVRPARHAMSHGVLYILPIVLPQIVLRGFRISACCGVQKGSLDGALRGVAPPGDGPPRLHWHLRIRLTAACADALSYLQSQPPQVDCLHTCGRSMYRQQGDCILRQELTNQFACHNYKQLLPCVAGATVLYIICLSPLITANCKQIERLIHNALLCLSPPERLLLTLANSVCQQDLQWHILALRGSQATKTCY